MRLLVARLAMDFLVGPEDCSTVGAERGENAVTQAAAALVHPGRQNFILRERRQRHPGNAVALIVLVAVR